MKSDEDITWALEAEIGLHGMPAGPEGRRQLLCEIWTSNLWKHDMSSASGARLLLELHLVAQRGIAMASIRPTKYAARFVR